MAEQDPFSGTGYRVITYRNGCLHPVMDVLSGLCYNFPPFPLILLSLEDNTGVCLNSAEELGFRGT